MNLDKALNFDIKMTFENDLRLPTVSCILWLGFFIKQTLNVLSIKN